MQEHQDRAEQDRAESGALRAEADRLQGDIDPLRLETDRLAAIVRDRDAEVAAALAERDRHSVNKETARVEAGRLRMSLHELERMHLDRGEQDAAELDRIRAENEELRARIDRCTTSHATPPAVAHVGEDQPRVQALQQELADLRRVAGEMRRMLEGIGIRFREH